MPPPPKVQRLSYTIFPKYLKLFPYSQLKIFIINISIVQCCTFFIFDYDAPCNTGHEEEEDDQKSCFKPAQNRECYSLRYGYR